MKRLPPNPAWFDELLQGGTREHFLWLERLASPVECIADFGCWRGAEPFAPMWALDAHSVVVVQQEPDNLSQAREQLEILKRTVPHSLQGRSVEFIVGDMSTRIAGLASSRFDLACCEDVLYYMQSDLDRVQAAVNEMARVVWPQGWVVAVEPKFGARFEDVEHKPLGAHSVQISDPVDISSRFGAVGLIRVPVSGYPYWVYCYRKP